MKRDSKLSGVLHVLLHMYAAEKPLTSEDLAQAMHTNPVVVRRTLSGLRELGMVRSEKGHGGGWTLARDIDAISLYDVYMAIGAPLPFGMANRTESPGCIVEQVVNESLDAAFDAAEALLIAQFKAVSLASLAAEFQQRYLLHKQQQGVCL